MDFHSNHDIGANVGSWGLFLLSITLNFVSFEHMNQWAEFAKNCIQIGAGLSAGLLSAYTLIVRIKERKEKGGQ